MYKTNFTVTVVVAMMPGVQHLGLVGHVHMSFVLM